jgi:CHAD domain-containing protein
LIIARFRAVQVDGDSALAGGTIEELHALRIDCKKLRYALEFFAPVLGAEARVVIDEVKALQDHLGDLNDAQVAVELLSAFLEGTPAGKEGIGAYIQFCEAERERLIRSFPDAWAEFNRPALQQSLLAAVTDL